MIGIYKLYWPNSEYYYIGQSININVRFKGHIRALRRGKHFSKKLQDVYHQLGEPLIVVLEGCKKSELSDKEIFWLESHVSGEYCCNVSLINPRRSCTLDFSLEEYNILLQKARSKGFNTVNALLMHICRSL